MRKLLKIAQELNFSFFIFGIVSMLCYYILTRLNCTSSDLFRVLMRFGIKGFSITLTIEIIIKTFFKEEKKEDQKC
jgi:hypothetical protein